MEVAMILRFGWGRSRDNRKVEGRVEDEGGQGEIGG
jgi:hypothetical protein